MQNSTDKWGYRLDLHSGTDHDKFVVDLYFDCNGKRTDVIFRLSYDNGKDDVRINSLLQGKEDEIEEIPLAFFLEGVKAAKEKLIDDGQD